MNLVIVVKLTVTGATGGPCSVIVLTAGDSYECFAGCGSALSSCFCLQLCWSEHYAQPQILDFIERSEMANHQYYRIIHRGFFLHNCSLNECFYTGSLVWNSARFALKTGNVKAVMRTRESPGEPNPWLPVGGGLISVALELWLDRVTVKATRTWVRTCSVSKGTCACVLADILSSTKHT